MKKILFVVNDASFFISHRLPIARQLVQEGYDVHLATSGETLSIYNEVGLNFHKLEFSRRGTRTYIRVAKIDSLHIGWAIFQRIP